MPLQLQIHVIFVFVVLAVLFLAVFCGSIICCHICYQRGLKKGSSEVGPCSVTRPTALEELEELEEDATRRSSSVTRNTRPINTPFNNVIWTEDIVLEVSYLPQPGAIQSNV